MKLDARADVTVVYDCRDACCLARRDSLTSCARREQQYVFFSWWQHAKASRLAPTETPLCATLKQGHVGFLFGFAFLLQPLSADLRCSEVQVEEPFHSGEAECK